jgi:hypothetical protein
VKTSAVRQLTVDLDGAPLDLDKPIEVSVDGQVFTIAQPAGLALFERDSADGDWRYEPGGTGSNPGPERRGSVGGTNDNP